MDAVVGAPSFEIIQGPREIALRAPDGQERTLRSDGKKRKEHGVSQKARWKDGRLLVETEARPFKVKEVFTVDPAAALMTVEVTAERRLFGGKITLKRVYRRVSRAPSPE